MPKRHSEEPLAQKFHVAVILRLVIDRRARLLYGDLVDRAGKTWGRFIGWRGLNRALQAWLATVEPDVSSDLPVDPKPPHLS